MKKGRFETMNTEYDYDEDEVRKPKKDEPRRRPVRNWKKAWDAHTADYDEADDFYAH